MPEEFGLAAQMRIAAVSIVSDVAEGAAKNTKREFTKYLHTAQHHSQNWTPRLSFAENWAILLELLWSHFVKTGNRE